MQLAQEILEKLQVADSPLSSELNELFTEIETALESCTLNELELPQDFLLERILAQALQTSSTQAIKLFETALKRVSLKKTADFFGALTKIAPCNDGSGMINLDLIPPEGVKLIPWNCPSFAPDILAHQKDDEPRTKRKPDESETEDRKLTTEVQYKASEWEIKRKEALYAYLQDRCGEGMYRALVSSDITQTIQNFFGFAELEAEGRVYLRHVCEKEAAELDGSFKPSERELRRIFVDELSQPFLQSRRGFVLSVAVSEEECTRWTNLHGCSDFSYDR